MQIGETGFRALTQITREVAETACGGRIAYILEGGYSAQGLAEGTTAVLTSMLDPAPGPLPKTVEASDGSNLRHIVSTVSQVQQQNFACIHTL